MIERAAGGPAATGWMSVWWSGRWRAVSWLDRLAVAYNLRADGSVDYINFSPATIG